MTCASGPAGVGESIRACRGRTGVVGGLLVEEGSTAGAITKAIFLAMREIGATAMQHREGRPRCLGGCRAKWHGPIGKEKKS